MDGKHNKLVRVWLCGGNTEGTRQTILATTHFVRPSNGWNLTTATTVAIDLTLYLDVMELSASVQLTAIVGTAHLEGCRLLRVVERHHDCIAQISDGVEAMSQCRAYSSGYLSLRQWRLHTHDNKAM